MDEQAGGSADAQDGQDAVRRATHVPVLLERVLALPTRSGLEAR